MCIVGRVAEEGSISSSALSSWSLSSCSLSLSLSASSLSSSSDSSTIMSCGSCCCLDVVEVVVVVVVLLALASPFPREDDGACDVGGIDCWVVPRRRPGWSCLLGYLGREYGVQ